MKTTTQRWVDDVFDKWKKWIRIYPNIGNVKILCWFSINSLTFLQFNVFANEGNRKKIFVAYFRIQSADVVKASLVRAKSKAALEQQLSIQLVTTYLRVDDVNDVDHLKLLTWFLILIHTYFWKSSNFNKKWYFNKTKSTKLDGDRPI